MLSASTADGSSLVIRQKTLGPALWFVVGALIFLFGYSTGPRNWVAGVGLAGLALGVIELVWRHYHPILTVRPWGISYRKSMIRPEREYPQQEVVSWFDSSVEVKINLRGGKTITIELAQLPAGDATRLVSALREFGYTFSSAYVQEDPV